MFNPSKNTDIGLTTKNIEQKPYLEAQQEEKQMNEPQSQQRRSYNSFKGITPKAQSTKQNSDQQKHKTKTSPNKKNPSL